MPTPQPTPQTSPARHRKDTLFTTMNIVVFILSLLLIVFISIDTFKDVNFLQNRSYMTFQLWVCIFFIIDFFVGLFHTDNKKRYFWNRIIFLFLSIPYLNLIGLLDIPMNHTALYFIRFIPLARGALALAIVTGYVSDNAITNLFISYTLMLLALCYFCSLIFYHCEHGVNKAVESYWSALWWSAMKLTTVGCDISPVTPMGKIINVFLPISGMVMFPLVTVYLTNYVTRKSKGHLPM